MRSTRQHSQYLRHWFYRVPRTFPSAPLWPHFQGQPGPASTASAGGDSAFITKLNPAATGSAQLAYSSYLGGNTQDDAQGIAVDATGNAYHRRRDSVQQLSHNGTQVTTGLKSAAGNAFLTKINTTASGAASSGVLHILGRVGRGGSGSCSAFADIAFGVAIDTNSNAYVVGGTTSTDFPTAGTAIPGSATCGANGNGSAFISVINTTNGSLGYSHCLTGTGQEYAAGVSLGTGVPAVTTKVAYITGQTFSSDFPVTTPSIPVGGGSVTGGVAFVSLVNTNSTTPLQYSTFLGGTNGDTGNSVGSDALGNAYVVGTTASSDFPVTPEHCRLSITIQPKPRHSFQRLALTGQGIADLIYSTYYGRSRHAGSPLTERTLDWESLFLAQMPTLRVRWLPPTCWYRRQRSRKRLGAGERRPQTRSSRTCLWLRVLPYLLHVLILVRRQ